MDDLFKVGILRTALAAVLDMPREKRSVTLLTLRRILQRDLGLYAAMLALRYRVHHAIYLRELPPRRAWNILIEFCSTEITVIEFQLWDGFQVE